MIDRIITSTCRSIIPKFFSSVGCTGNSLDTIPPPLLDRCEAIQLSRYTYDEKSHIERRFLLLKQVAQNGLCEDHVQITKPALLRVVTHYTRETAYHQEELVEVSGGSVDTV